MADSNESKPVVPVQRSTKPVSEALLNEKVRRHIVLDILQFGGIPGTYLLIDIGRAEGKSATPN